MRYARITAIKGIPDRSKERRLNNGTGPAQGGKAGGSKNALLQRSKPAIIIAAYCERKLERKNRNNIYVRFLNLTFIRDT